MIPASIDAAAPPLRPPAKLRRPASAKRGEHGAAASPDSTTVPVPLPSDLLRALQAWIVSRPEPRLALPAVIRFALRDWLMAQDLREHLGPDDGGPDRGNAASPPFGPPAA